MVTPHLFAECYSALRGIFTTPLCRSGIKLGARALSCDCPPPPEPPPAPCDMCQTGYKQSPVDICVQTAKKIELPALTFSNHFNEDANFCMFLMDNTINLVPNGILMSLEGGPLSGLFILEKCHFHWGCSETEGTEHSVDRKKYAMEAHLKYYNCSYGCFSKAQNQPDGVAVVSVLMAAKPGSMDCDFDAVVRCLPSVVPNKSYPITKNVFKMFQKTFENQQYFTYEGSLTMPPCSEEVTWLVFKTIMCVDCAQVAPFRKLCSPKNELILNNCRDLQSLNGRRVYDVRSRPKEPDC